MLRRIQWDVEEEEQEGMEEAEAPKAPNYCRLVWQVGKRGRCECADGRLWL